VYFSVGFLVEAVQCDFEESLLECDFEEGVLIV
jgi:hypothetical protein